MRKKTPNASETILRSSRAFAAFVLFWAAIGGAAHGQYHETNPGRSSFYIKPDGSQCYGDGDGCAACHPAPGAGSGGGRAVPHYGAIAITVALSDSLGYSYAWGNRAQAERNALANCEKEAGRRGACQIALWFYNGCAALAKDADGHWGADYAPTTGQAERKAYRLCWEQRDAGDCRILVSYCSR